MSAAEPPEPVDPDLAPTDPAQPPRTRPGPRGGRARPAVLAAVAAGGMVGASARYGLALWLPPEPGAVPWATLGANLVGSFLLGALVVVVGGPGASHPLLRPFAATGVLGAFTTMATYQVETAQLIGDGHPVTAAVYAAGSLVAGVLLAWAGIVTGRGWQRRAAL